MTKLELSKVTCVVSMFCIAASIASPAKTIFTSLVSFDVTNGSSPYFVSLVQGIDGNFYGTTAYGGAYGQNCYAETCGTVFKITPAGILTTLHSFDFTDGGYPEAGLVQTTNGNFYGTTAIGGSSGYGTIFKIKPAGKLTTVYEFQNSTDGGNPLGALVQASNGIFYGTTSYGGGTCGCGTVFKVTSAGKLTTLHTFNAGGTGEGNYPQAGLVQGTDGNLYGTTAYGGASGYGTIFKITPAGTLTTLHSFDISDGANPYAGVVEGTDGNFYGTTLSGGANGYGTVFKITPAGTLTTLHSFDITDGASLSAGVAEGSDGNFYGTTLNGGASRYGTVFKITPAGTLTTIHNFDDTDGATAQGGLAQATNGTFYGTTSAGGASDNCAAGCGTVFSLKMGLGPFVQTLPTSGKVGAKVIILGNNLADTTSVTFNGTAATFTVVSGTEIKTKVPKGATTGPVQAVTPGGTLTSNVNFQVMP
jgi:uncharacterized repeat protein (TIGR03803 family)